MAHKTRLHFGLVLLTSLAFVASACVSTRLEASNDHPANSQAPTTPLPLDASLSAPVSPTPPPAEAPSVERPHDHATPSAGVTYTCPMHPEIVRDSAGKCPICGMTLVKRETPAPRGAEH
jgi:membrane fusion protein, copper/silver efflux system